MNSSENINELAAALAKAQGQMGGAKKDSANPFFKSSYADLSSVVEAIKKPFSDNGLSYTQLTDYDDTEAVIIVTRLMHSSGQWIEGRLRMKPAKNDPQGIGSTITYARRYALQSLAGVPAEDDDGNAGTHGSSGATLRIPAKPSLSQEQRATLDALIYEVGADVPKLLAHFKVGDLSELNGSRFTEAVSMLERKRKAS